MTEAATLLAAHAALPEPRQPAWGLAAGHDAVRRACEERLAIILPMLQTLPCEGTLRILELECAQGYFTLALAQALAAQGRTVEVVGVDRHEENVKFCEALAAHHGIKARFICGALDAGFIGQQATSNWDVVLAFRLMALVDEAQASEMEHAADWLLAHARITLYECVEDHQASAAAIAWRALDAQLLAAHACARRLASLATLPGEAMRSLHVCSKHLAWVGERWFAFDRVADRTQAQNLDSRSDERRIYIGPKVVIKALRGDGRHGSEHRTELAAEAAVLLSLPGDPSRFPALLAQADDGDVVWLVREALHGDLLSTRIVAGKVDRDAVACGLLAELARLQSLGFQHAALRCWNCLVDGTSVRVIDFAALVRTDSPLPRVALAAVLLELAGDHARHESPFYAGVHPLGVYPVAWQPLLRYLLGAPQAAFSYAEAQRILMAALSDQQDETLGVGVTPQPDAELLAAAVREQGELFQRLRQYGEAMERSLDGNTRARAAELDETRQLRARLIELERAHMEYVASLRTEIEQSHAYADSLKATLERERADAHIALAAMEDARHAAVEHVETLAKALDESNRQAAQQAAQLAWMRHRFRWLKPLWPPQPEAAKDPE